MRGGAFLGTERAYVNAPLSVSRVSRDTFGHALPLVPASGSRQRIFSCGIWHTRECYASNQRLCSMQARDTRSFSSRVGCYEHTPLESWRGDVWFELDIENLNPRIDNYFGRGSSDRHFMG